MLQKTFKTWAGVALLFTVTGFATISMYFVHNSLEQLPSVDDLGQYVPPLVTNIVDVNGLPIGEFFTERRTTVPLTKIPVDIRSALIATEDSDFYTHWGVDMQAILRAGWANFKAGRVVQGGSTLTQQLAKTIYLTREKTIIRKFKEMLLTLQIEYKYSKDEILQLYLNQIYFGGGAYGVEAGARLYFDKHAQELNLPECALLAGLIRSPNRYSPLKNPDLSKSRRAHVLKRMKTMGFITDSEEKEGNEFPMPHPGFVRKAKEAPYFLEEIRKQLEPTYGAELLEQGGLTIQSTLDLKMQQAAEKILEAHLKIYDMKFATATLIE